MYFEGTKPLRPAFIFLAILFTFTLSACSSQEPAFKEERTTRHSGDSKVATNGAGGSSEVENGLADTETGIKDDNANSNVGSGGGEDLSGSDGSSGSDGGAGSDGAAGPGGSSGTGGTAGSDGSPGTDSTAGSDGTPGMEGGGSADGSGTGGGTDATSGGGTDGTGGGGTTGGGTDTAGTDGADSGMDAGTGTDGGMDSGSEPPIVRRTVNVVQKGPGKVDILWIVDSSGSMSEEQTYLGNNFNSFINNLVTAGHDFQTAVTSTDICTDSIPSDLAQRACPVNYGGSSATRHRGSFVGDTDRKVLKHTDSDIVAKFTNYTKVGTSGSGFEHGLKAAQMALEKVANGMNAPLIRADAFLAVIVVSDEEDDGIGLSLLDPANGRNFTEEGLTTFKFTEDNMIEYLKVIKGEGKFSVSSIAPTRNTDGSICSSSHSKPNEEGTQYIKAAQKTGGMIQSICETNWSVSLGKLGYDLNAQLTQIVLPSVPSVDSIKVKVNATLVTDWTFNAGNNAVKFNANSVPAEGARIDVEYLEAR